MVEVILNPRGRPIEGGGNPPEQAIPLATREGTSIPNAQEWELAAQDRRQVEDVLRKWTGPRTVARGQANPIYNCHGMTFASRRTRVFDRAALDAILSEDGYAAIQDVREVLPGDVILYVDASGDVVHSGMIVETDLTSLHIVTVCSKWGSGPEMLHPYATCPYMPAEVRFYRCR